MLKKLKTFWESIWNKKSALLSIKVEDYSSFKFPLHLMGTTDVNFSIALENIDYNTFPRMINEIKAAWSSKIFDLIKEYDKMLGGDYLSNNISIEACGSKKLSIINTIKDYLTCTGNLVLEERETGISILVDVSSNHASVYVTDNNHNVCHSNLPLDTAIDKFVSLVLLQLPISS